MDATPLVQERGVDHAPHRPVDTIGGQALQKRLRPGPVTSSLAKGVRSNRATPSRVARCSAPQTGDQLRAAHPSRAGQSQPQAFQERLVGAEPLRALPAGALEEHRAQRLLGPERATAQSAGALRLLPGVDDVVDLHVLPGGAGPHVRPGSGVGPESSDVALTQVQAGAAFDHPLGQGPAGAPGVGDPHRLGSPRAAHLRERPQEGEAIRREREQPVKSLRQPGLAERRSPRVLQGTGEVLGREGGRMAGWSSWGIRSGSSRRGSCEYEPKGRAVAVLPEVEVTVLVAQDRVAHLGRLAATTQASGVVFAKRCCTGVRGTKTPASSPSSGPQIPGREDERLRLDAPGGSLHGAHPAAGDVNSGDGTVQHARRAPARCASPASAPATTGTHTTQSPGTWRAPGPSGRNRGTRRRASSAPIAPRPVRRPWPARGSGAAPPGAPGWWPAPGSPPGRTPYRRAGGRWRRPPRSTSPGASWPARHCSGTSGPGRGRWSPGCGTAVLDPAPAHPGRPRRVRW